MSEARIDWRRISRGLTWIGFGTFLLLNTSGALPWSFWIEALLYWPVLLVALGLRMIFERSKMPALILLSPLVILGTLTWVGYGSPHGPAGAWIPIEARRPPDAVEWSLEGDLAFGRLDVSAGPVAAERLAEGRPAAARGATPALRVRGADQRPRVRMGRREGSWSILGPRRREHWDVEVTPELPLLLDLDMAFTRGGIDLEQAPVTRVDLDGAFNSLTLRLGEVEEGEEIRIYLDGAFNEYDLVVPAATPVRVRTHGFLTRHHGRGRGAPSGKPGYRVYLDGAFSRVEVRSD